MRRRNLQLFLSMLLASCGAQQQRPLVTIEVRPEGRLMALPVTIGQSRQWFMWDTGAPSLVIDPRLARELNLKPSTVDAVSGTGTGSVPISHSSPVHVHLGNQSYVVADPWIIDLSAVPISKDVRGLVGADLWSRYAVRMNSQEKTIELFRAGTYRPAGDEIALPLIAVNNRLFMDVTLDVRPGLTKTERLRIDTGSEDSVNAPIVGQALEVRRSTLGNGLGANFEGASGRMQAVHIGPFTIRDVWGPGGKGPSIGMEMLRRFVVTFDARAGKIYLKPTAALSEPVPPPGE
jgi:predicted aspartyl protease